MPFFENNNTKKKKSEGNKINKYYIDTYSVFKLEWYVCIFNNKPKKNRIMLEKLTDPALGYRREKTKNKRKK